jgi:CRP-like cAMP-binding protein
MTERPPAGFLAALSTDAREVLMARGRRRRYKPGSALWHEGDTSDWIAIVLAGRTKVSYVTEEGVEVLLEVREPGDILGEIAALDGGVRSAAVTAIDQVEVLDLSAGAFRVFLESHPRVALHLLEMLARRLRQSGSRQVEFGAYDALGRVARRLVELADRFGEKTPGGVAINLPLSQSELAGWVGASRESVAKALQTLRSLGWVETGRRQTLVKDLEALRRRSGTPTM